MKKKLNENVLQSINIFKTSGNFINMISSSTSTQHLNDTLRKLNNTNCRPQPSMSLRSAWYNRHLYREKKAKHNGT